MQTGSSPLFHKLSSEYIRRLEIAMAAAVEARLQVHAEQALNVVAVFAPRLSFDNAVERYLDVMNLSGEEAQIVRTRALVELGDSGVAEQLSKDPPAPRRSWKYATPLGAVRFVRRQLRRNAEEDLWMELSAARAEEALVRMHVRHALNFVQILSDELPPTRAVSLYIEQLEVAAGPARSVYQRALARVASVELPRLPGSTSESPTGRRRPPRPPR